ncbi:MAG: glycoside hydrolase family 13 protein [Bacteroidetes bacterium]|nr:glycoside hydrolase family 13 protein [Bacteroidota bacterium]
MKRVILLMALLLPACLFAAPAGIDRVEPPFWWTGFKNTNLQIMIHGKDIANTTVSITGSNPGGLSIIKVHTVGNPNYLFIDLKLGASAKPGVFKLCFSNRGQVVESYNYELKQRKPGSAGRKSFDNSDVIYLIMPDRFANGDITNDNIAGMKENVDRSKPDSRHGGDIKGIMDHLDYLKELGVTTLWMTPLLENDQPVYSYHGYSATDFYKVDPRFGTNDDYVKLGDALHQKGMKLIIDQVFNHCGSEHWWMKDLPSDDWINQWPEFTRSTYRAGSVSDPYVSATDSIKFNRGWFDKTMPDLNQRNPYMKNYLIQNSIWWMEYASIDGIRQDTYPYPFKDMMSEWGKRMLEEYPNLNIVGECWMNYPATVAYWQKGSKNLDGFNSNLPSVFDFPLHDALIQAFNEKEGWNTGILRLYEIIAQDFSYPKPMDLVTFADNHDVNRYLDTQNDDIRKLKMAMAFILTTRGIPEIFYGTELLMTTGADKGHGTIRRDVPGGWQGDSRNAFTAAGRNDPENDMYNMIHNLLHYRKSSTALQTGKLLHFVPEDGIYTYFRYNSQSTVMVIMNNNEEQKTLETGRYKEVLKNFSSGREICNGKYITDLSKLTIPSKSVLIIELKH